MRLRDQDPRELSVYLAQHRENPIDWYEWGPEAWEKAVELDVPVLVSIGYSSCHWCHVMAHESFEDPTIGALVNERFVSIKVDREERPDVDAVYMDAVQASTGRGGWPMTVFCTPDGRPFFAGTYFGRRTDGHRIGFEDLCRHIDELWRERRVEIMERADALTEAIADGDELPEPLLSGSGDSSSRVDTMSLVDTMIDGLESQVDVQHGGFGHPPKFPHGAAIDALLRHHRRTGDRRSRDLALLTLNAMASGGIFDHLGGGFARYSTDDRWLVPHFEKMLPDQALLARVYLHAWQSTGDPHWHRIMAETIGYVRRDLGHALGGFHSAEDADTEGVEGRYYVWTPDEIRIACGPDAEAVIDWFGVTETGNWEGTTVLNRIGQPPRERPPAVERGCRALLAARTRRVRPGVDTKIVTEWNALMIATLAEAGAATAEPDWVNAGVAAGEFLCRSLRRPDGRWLRSWQPAGEGARGRPGAPAFAADLAALVDAFVRLHEATGDARWLAEAVTTAEQLLDLFGDDQEAGLFTTGRDGDRLITRPKEWIEGAQPSANSLAAVALLRLAALTGDERWSIPARAIVDRVSGALTRAPLGFAHLLWALELDSFPVTEIVITGDRPDLVAAVHEHWNPSAVLTWGSPQDSPLWWGRDERGAQGRAYVCRDHVCERPVDTVSALQAQLTT